MKSIQNNNEVYEIFDSPTQDLFDYRDDANAYEIEESSRPDEMMMLDSASKTVNGLLDFKQNAAVLDICCGTGLSLKDVVNHKSIKKSLGLDQSEEYLRYAKSRFQSCKNLTFIRGDAVDCEISENSWDIIILASSYHHIEDDRKLQFLQRISKLLKSDGLAIFAENILPPYNCDSKSSYNQAVRMFYQQVIETATGKNSNLSHKVKELIHRVAQYGFDGEYEFKVSMEIFLDHLKISKLTIVDQKKVWPFSGPMSLTTGGNYIVVVKSNNDLL